MGVIKVEGTFWGSLIPLVEREEHLRRKRLSREFSSPFFLFLSYLPNFFSSFSSSYSHLYPNALFFASRSARTPYVLFFSLISKELKQRCESIEDEYGEEGSLQRERTNSELFSDRIPAYTYVRVSFAFFKTFFHFFFCFYRFFPDFPLSHP